MPSARPGVSKTCTSDWWSRTMLQIELTTQLRRMRSLLVFGGLAALIIIAGVSEAPKAGGKGGPATFSALNFTESGLNFVDPVLLGLVIALRSEEHTSEL